MASISYDQIQNNRKKIEANIKPRLFGVSYLLAFVGDNTNKG
jgi:hypothetical protein